MTNKWQILIVDDEPLNLEIISEHLATGPYALTTAGNGAEAWDRLNRAGSHYDLLLLDRMMPVMDGFALLDRIKETASLAHLPVIMQTAAADPQQIREGLAAGCYYYLTKPYSGQALTSIVSAVLGEVRAARELSTSATLPPRQPPSSDADYLFSTPEEARRLAAMLASLCPNPANAAMGLGELLLNAVEHGNLGITYDEKKQLKLSDRWEAEVTRRLNQPEHKALRATVSFARRHHELVFTITDQGHGFDWKQYLDFDPARAFDPNGRGIAMAKKLAFHRLEYLGCGSCVVATIQL